MNRKRNVKHPRLCVSWRFFANLDLRLFSVSPSAVTGATLIEFSAVSLLFFLLVFGILDIARYMAVRGVLTKGAQQGLNLAKKVEGIDIDVSAIQPDGPEWERFLEAHNAVIRRAMALPLAGLVRDTSAEDAAAKLLEIRQSKRTGAGMTMLPPPDATSGGPGAVLLFPGETATLNLGDGEETIIRHPVCASDDPDPSCRARLTGDDWRLQDQLRNYPMVVEMHARVRFLFPFLGETTVRARAMGFREIPPVGAYPIPPADIPLTTQPTVPGSTSTVPNTQPSTTTVSSTAPTSTVSTTELTTTSTSTVTTTGETSTTSSSTSTTQRVTSTSRTTSTTRSSTSTSHSSSTTRSTTSTTRLSSSTSSTTSTTRSSSSTSSSFTTSTTSTSTTLSVTVSVTTTWGLTTTTVGCINQGGWCESLCNKSECQPRIPPIDSNSLCDRCCICKE